MRVQPLLQVRPHRHRHAHRAQHQRHQAHQRQQARRPVQPLRQRRIRLAIVDHLRLGQQLLQTLLQLRHRLVRDRRAILRRRHPEQKPLPRMASRSQQPARLQPLARDQHPRPGGEAARQPVRLVRHHRRDTKPLVADLQLIANMQLQPHQQVVRHHHCLRRQRLPQSSRRIQLDRPVERILRRIHRLQRHQQRIHRRRRTRHRQQLRHRRNLHALPPYRVQPLLLVRRRLLKHSR